MTATAYHGTDADFDTFDLAFAREGAVFLSSEPLEAAKFASEAGWVLEVDAASTLVVDGMTIPRAHTAEDIAAVVDAGRRGGHDTILVEGFRDLQIDPIDTWIVLDPAAVTVVDRRLCRDVRNEAMGRRFG